MRVLKWIVDRVNNRVEARETPLGLFPYLKDLDREGLNIPEERLEKLFEVNPQDWQKELEDIEKFLSQFGKHLPQEIHQELNKMGKDIRAVETVKGAHG